MKKKVLEVVFDPPKPAPIVRQYDADKVKASFESGVLKLKEEGGGIILMIPAERVNVVSFGEAEVESPILHPTEVMRPTGVPNKFEPS